MPRLAIGAQRLACLAVVIAAAGLSLAPVSCGRDEDRVAAVTLSLVKLVAAGYTAGYGSEAGLPHWPRP